MKILTKTLLVYFLIGGTYSAFAQIQPSDSINMFEAYTEELVQIFAPIDQKLNDSPKTQQVNIHHNLGFLQAKLGNYPEAINHYQKAWALLPAENFFSQKAILQNHMAIAYTQSKNYPEAKKHFQQALSLAKVDKRVEAQIHNAFASFYLAQGQVTAARKEVRQALFWARSVSALDALTVSYRILAELYRQESKLNLHNQYIGISQSLQAKIDSSRAQTATLDSLQIKLLYAEADKLPETFESKPIDELAENPEEEAIVKEEVESEDKENKSYYSSLAVNGVLLLGMIGSWGVSLFLMYNFYSQKAKTQEMEEEMAQKDETIVDQKEDFEELQYELMKKEQSLHENLMYADRIQSASMAPDSILTNAFPEHFILFQPKNVVGGDFYWTKNVDNKIYIAVGDCTGHGVRGALLALITQSYLNEILQERDLGEPYRIVEHLHMKMNKILQPDDPYDADRIHITLCRIEKTADKEYNVTFSGSRQNLYYYRHQDQEIYELKGDRKGVGDYVSVRNLLFTQESISLQEKDTLYLYTNGFADAHNRNKERIGTKRFRDTLYHIASSSLEKQKQTLEEEITHHTEGTSLIDDITILGLKLGETTKESIFNSNGSSPSIAMSLLNNNKEFNFFDYYAQISQGKIVLSYKGPLTDVLLSEFSRDIRSKIQDRPKIGKKVFAIFMELAQNVLFYSKEINHFGNRDRVGTLVILQDENHYKIITGNLVYKSATALLQEKCEMVNSLDREALREYKRQLRNAPKNKESRGAGIGIVQVALTSANPIEYEIKELSNNFAFFVISVKVEK